MLEYPLWGWQGGYGKQAIAYGAGPLATWLMQSKGMASAHSASYVNATATDITDSNFVRKMPKYPFEDSLGWKTLL